MIETKEDLTKALKDIFGGHVFDIETHREHHEFISILIERERRKTELWEKIKAQVAGSLILSGLGGALAAVYHVFFKHG